MWELCIEKVQSLLYSDTLFDMNKSPRVESSILADVEREMSCRSRAFPLLSDLSDSEGSALTLSNTHLQHLKSRRWVSVECGSLLLEFVALPYSAKCRASDKRENGAPLPLKVQ